MILSKKNKISGLSDNASGFSDLLNYAAPVDDGVVLCKDGSFLAGFYYQGDDPESSSDDDKNHLTATVNNYSHRFGTGWAVWTDAIRTPSPGYPDPSQCHFPDPISALIDAERREQFEEVGTHFETEYAMVFSFHPPSRAASKFSNMFYSDKSHNTDEAFFQVHLAEFKKKISFFYEGLKRELFLRRMGTIKVDTEIGSYISDELVNYISYCLNGKKIKLRLPQCPLYMDTWIGADELWVGDMPKFGQQYVACVSVDGYPEESNPGMLGLIERLPLSLRWSSRYIFLDQQPGLEVLEKKFRQWNLWAGGNIFSQVKKARGGVGRDDLDSIAMRNEVEQAVKDAKSGEITNGYYTSVIVLMDEDPVVLEQKATYVATQIETTGFHARIERINTQEAWRGTFPGHIRENVRKVFLHTLNLADLMPLSTIWPGSEFNPCPFFPEKSPPLMYSTAAGSTPFRFNNYVGDVGHTFVGGPTGHGKSVFLAMLGLQHLRYVSKQGQPATLEVLDSGYSMYTACKAVGGKHYDIGAEDSGLSLFPLGEIDTVADRAWAASWIETCYELQTERKLTTSQRHLVLDALRRMSDADKETRSLSEFIHEVQDDPIKEAMRHYAKGGALGKLLDGNSDPIQGSHCIVYEIGALMGMKDVNALPVLLYLFRRFRKSLKGQPAMLVMDEAWLVFARDFTREILVEYLRGLRKEFCSVVLATHNLSDAAKSGIMDIILQLCLTKIWLPNHEANNHGTAGSPGAAEFYAAAGLTASERNLLSKLQPKRQYYYRSPLGRRVFDMELGPLALSIVGVSDIEEVREVRKFEAEYGENWVHYWMKSKGVKYEKYILQ